MNYKNIKLCLDYVWIVWILVGIQHKLIKLKKHNSTSFEVSKMIAKTCLNCGLGFENDCQNLSKLWIRFKLDQVNSFKLYIYNINFLFSKPLISIFLKYKKVEKYIFFIFLFLSKKEKLESMETTHKVF